MKDLVHGCRIERADAFLLLSMGVFIGACQMVFCVIFLKLSLNIQTILYIFACFSPFLGKSRFDFLGKTDFNIAFKKWRLSLAWKLKMLFQRA